MLTMHYQNTSTLCIVDVPGAKIGTDVGSRLANAREEQFGKSEINLYFNSALLVRFLSLNSHCSVGS